MLHFILTNSVLLGRAQRQRVCENVKVLFDCFPLQSCVPIVAVVSHGARTFLLLASSLSPHLPPLPLPEDFAVFLSGLREPADLPALHDVEIPLRSSLIWQADLAAQLRRNHALNSERRPPKQQQTTSQEQIARNGRDSTCA